MTIVAHTDERGAHRLEASLEKLVDVLLAENISTRALLERDLALIKVSADQQNRPHLMELIKVFRARVVDVAPESLIIEVPAPSTKSMACSKYFGLSVCLKWPAPDGFP